MVHAVIIATLFWFPRVSLTCKLQFLKLGEAIISQKHI